MKATMKEGEPRIRLEERVQRCGFCGKWEKEVQALMAGMDDALVCDECVALMAGMLGSLQEKA